MSRREMERASESKQGSQEERNHVSRTGRLRQGPAGADFAQLRLRFTKENHLEWEPPSCR